MMMKRAIAFLPLVAMMFLTSCSKKQSSEAPAATEEMPTTSAETSDTPQLGGGPRAVIHLKNGNKVQGTIVASSQTDMVVAGAGGIETKIPLGQIKSVEYVESQNTASTAEARREPAQPAKTPLKEQPALSPAQPAREPAQRTAELPVAVPPAPRAVTTKTYELPAGSEISVRTNEPIDSETAAEGQTFDAQVTRDAVDLNGDIVIPRGSDARVVIKSASKGGRFKGASDLVLDMQSVTTNGKQYRIDTVDVTKSGKSGVGANKRTAVYTGGGAALGAIIGAIAGGGKGAAIGAGAGAGAGALTQILTKGRSIKVPAESVLTYKLDKPLKVTDAE